MNLLSYIHWPSLIVSFLLGLIFIYYHSGEPIHIYIYPTNKNIENVQVKDTTGSCFSVKTEKIQCPADKSKIKQIPMQ